MGPRGSAAGAPGAQLPIVITIAVLCRPLICRCRGRSFEPSAGATFPKDFYKTFQRFQDYKNFSETSGRSRQPGHIGFSPVFPAYPAAPSRPSIFPFTVKIWGSPMPPAPDPEEFSAGGRLARLDALAVGTDRAARNRQKTSMAAFWWLLGVVIASITWSTSPNSRSRAQIRGRGDRRSKFRRCARFPRRLRTKRKSLVGSMGSKNS